ncbi:MAG: class I tRNA ligase family protein, partial [Oscillospiraceae bacterium]|nr:class I tRNA ligase family protein [Oscillospiraceae bacterium]
TAMVGKYFGANLVPERADDKLDCDLKIMVSTLRERYEKEMEAYQFQNALEEIFKCIQRANKYIDETAPWALAKDMEANGARLAAVLYNLLETIRICTVLLRPFMPASCEKIFAQIGAAGDITEWESAGKWGGLAADTAVSKGDAIFPRLDAEKALAELAELQEKAKKAALPAIETEPLASENVDFDTFCKSDFRAVKVKSCENVKKSEKLLKFILDDGTGTDRQILSGIAKWYKPEELVGKTLVAIVNLPPRKMMGQESCGMLLSAVHTEKGEEKLNLVMVSDAIPAGAKLC